MVGSRQIADGRIQSVGLQSVVGAYELVFPLYLTVPPGRDGMPRADVLGARVAARPSGGDPQPLGFAWPQQPIHLVCKEFVGTSTPALHMGLQPSQIVALETLRGAGELTFELSFTGTGVDRHGDQYLYGDFDLRVPRSDWLQTLRTAGARNAMLIEVPLPLEEDRSDGWSAVASSLQSAEEEYRTGNYRACVASCRIVIDELGGLHDLRWPRALNLLSQDRNGKMSKLEREEAVYATLRHYTHPAHHAAGASRETSFTRAEAQFILSATAAAVRLAQMS